MSRVEEIEAAIASLPQGDFQRLARWVHDLEQSRWDEQIDRDAASGKLDFLFREADEELANGALREWPPEE